MRAADFLDSDTPAGGNGLGSAADFLDAGDPPKKQNKGIAGDFGTDLKRGTLALPGTLTGLADIAVAPITGEATVSNAFNKLGGITGFQPGKWADEANAEYSNERVAARKQVDEAWKNGNAVDVAGAYLAHPLHNIAGSVVESLPSMVAGGVAGRGIAAATKIAPAIGGALGEGGTMAGQAMQNNVDAGVDPRKAAGYAALTGVAGAGIGAMGGKLAESKLAKRLGISDVDTVLAGGERAAAKPVANETIGGAIKAGAKRIAGGAVSEGVLEELPQSVVEQGLSNLAQGNDVTDGLARAAVEGTLAGGFMGGAFNAIPGGKYLETKAALNTNTTPQDQGSKQPDIAGLLPAPVRTGTPGDRIVAADVERQKAIDEAQRNADELYAARDAFEAAKAQLNASPEITLTTDPEPLQKRIDAMLGIDAGKLSDKAKQSYEQSLLAALNEPVGVTHDVYGIEHPLTMGAYLDAVVDTADKQREIDRAAEAPPHAPPLAAQSAPIMQSEATGNPAPIPDHSVIPSRIPGHSTIPSRIPGHSEIPSRIPEQSGIPSRIPAQSSIPSRIPVIPVVGPLSAAANMAVQTGVHQQHVQQQAATLSNATQGASNDVDQADQAEQAIAQPTQAGATPGAAAQPIQAATAEVAQQVPAAPSSIPQAVSPSTPVVAQNSTNSAEVPAMGGQPTVSPAVQPAAKPVAQPVAETPQPATVPAYKPGQAKMVAGKKTKEGTPSEVYPHPTEPGMMAVRPVAGTAAIAEPSAAIAVTGQAEPATDANATPATTPAAAERPDSGVIAAPPKLDLPTPAPTPSVETASAPVASTEQAQPNSDQFANNKIFTADKVAAARARLKSKLGTLNSGIDPELLIDGMTLAGAYIESGIRKFSDYAKAMVDDLGDGVKPYLLSFYEAARAYPGLNKMGMDSQESAAAQHQALLTPAVVEQAKEVVGKAPKVERKKPANLSEAIRLKQDWGVPSIDGYTRSKTGKNQETDYGLKGGIKDEFLADASRYLKTVEKLLSDKDFVPEVDRKGKPMKAVRSNEAGPAVSGEVYLSMSRGDFSVYAQVGVSCVRGIGPAHPQGVSLMVRAGQKNDMNHWMNTNLSAGELVDWFDKQHQSYLSRMEKQPTSATLEASEPTGESNGAQADEQSHQALAGMAAEQVPGATGSEPVDNSGIDGGTAGIGRDSGTDGSRGEAGRSGGNRSAEVHSSSAGGTAGGRGRGTDAGRTGRVESGTGRDGNEESARAGEPQPVLAQTPAIIPEGNFEITEEVALGSGGQMTKYRDNIAAIKILKTLETERRRATAPEKKALARYVGWGGIPNAFRNAVTGKVAKDWESEVAELESLLTPKELRAAAASTRNAHYTAKEVVDFMWGAVRKMGFAGGLVLEPSVGTGNFIGLMPKEFSGASLVTGIELDSLTSRIAGALYPKSNIINTGFQKAALPDNRFRLAIGNPPFGAESLRFQFKPELNGASIHNQFFLGSMDALEPGGIMAMVVSRYLMDAKDATTREKLAINAKLLGGVRLPGSAFKGNALTEVVTDVLFFEKRNPDVVEKLREAYFKRGKPFKGKDQKEIYENNALQRELEQALYWTTTAEVKDPLGGEPMVVSQYFARNPQLIVGKMERSGSMREDGDIDVKLEKGEKLADRLNAVLEKMQSLPPKSISAEAMANAEKLHKAMGESLRLSATGAEADAIFFDDDGDLSTVVEREGENGETALSTVKVNADTPWSSQLRMDLDGNWFREVVKTDKDGKPVKKIGANGKATKLNVYVREVFKKAGSIPKSLTLGESRYVRMKALIGIRDLLVEQINLEVSRASHEQMEGNRQKLREAYEDFTKEYGFISDAKNAVIVSDMPDEGLLMSLENSYRPEVTEAKAKRTGMKASPASAKPAAILTKAVAIPPAPKSFAETPVDALAISLSECGRIDIKRIAELRGLSVDAATAELTDGDTPLAFKDPEDGEVLVEKNAYLSGNVRRKLEAAKQANMVGNVKALETVQPEPWTSDKVTARIGSNWIPGDVYSEFLTHLLGDKGRVNYAKLTNVFEVIGNRDGVNATAKWGTKLAPAPDLLEDILNSRSTRIFVPDDGKPVFNQVETDAANDKRNEIIEEFDNWVFKDADRRAALTKLFNDQFNTRVTPQYDGSHLRFPGKVPDEIIQLRRGQINAVWRGIIEDAVLYDHAVGAGKTFTGIARAIERRRMGMSKKPTVVVPNHMVGEWAAQAYRLYPGARVLAATKKDLEAKNRRRLFAKIASGDWDLVIVPHSSFKFIAISTETEERLLTEELAIAQAALRDAEAEADPDSRFKSLSVKEAEALIDKIEKRIEAARGRGNKDNLLTFEQMGIDDLTIDESHEFKNLFYSSNLSDVRGMGNKQGSDKAFDLYAKTRVIREMGGSLAFLTGTPISNSAVELYNILRYLAPQTLQESGLEHFDAFRNQYVDATAKFEPTDSGGGLKLVTRLGRSWSNMRSLMELYYSVADVVTNDDIKRWYAEDNPGKEFPLPVVKGGDRRAVSVQPTPTQSRILDAVIDGFNALPYIKDIKARNAEQLRLMDRARKLSLHAKAVDPSLEDEPGGKLDKVADEVHRIYGQWTEDKGTQLVFIDRGVPKAKGDDKIIKEYDDLQARLREASATGNEDEARKIVDRLDAFDPNEIAELRAAQTSGWSAYQHVKDRLVSLGIPANEIAFVQDFTGDAAREQLFQAVRDGEVRVLIGSSPRMGAGTNVQERLVALHHVDATWKPSDIEQREGRIIRQGNALYKKYVEELGQKFEVEILAYVTERTVDAKLWDLNSTKLRMINAIRYYDGAFEMDFDDEAAIVMAEIAAIASGDPLLLERFKLSTEIDNLYRAKRSHRRRIESAEDSLRSAVHTVENAPKEAAESREDADLRSDFIEVAHNDAYERSITVNGETFTGAGSVTQAKMKFNSVADNVADDEKFSITINGKEITSKGAADELISTTLGDVEPFLAEINGKKIIRRSDYARELRAIVGEQLEENTEIPPTPAGSIGGIPVMVEVHKQWGNLAMFVGLTGQYESTGRRRSIVGARYITPDKHKAGTPIPVTVNGVRPLISDFEQCVLRLVDRSSDILAKADRAKQDIAGLKEQVQEPFKHQAELDEKTTRLAEVESQLSSRQSNTTNINDGVGSKARNDTINPADKAVFGMATEGKSAAEILKFIASASRNPFYRQVARLLIKTGIAPTITVGEVKDWKIRAGNDKRYAAAYNPKTDTVALFRAPGAERHMLHELVHAATLKAIAGKSMASGQMKVLFKHAQQTGKLRGMYGMTDVDEFVTEAFTNPKFQQALKGISAPTSGVKTAWHWFIRVVRGILGLPINQESALSQALELGTELMRENMRLNAPADGVSEIGDTAYDRTNRTRFAESGIRYNIADDGWSVSAPSKMDDVIYALQDKHVDTKRVMQAISRTGKKIRDAFNPYLQEELFHGRAAKRVQDFLTDELRPLLKALNDTNTDMGDFEEYLWNRHAEERNAQIAKINPDMPDGGSGIDTADARAYLAGLSAERRATFERLAGHIDAINRASQQLLVSSGLEKQSTIDAWNGAYAHYVPLQREDVETGHVGTGKGVSIRGSASKRAMGSGRKVVDIIGNLAMQRERNIVRAEKNRVSNALAGLAKENPNDDFWKVDQAPKERVVAATRIYTVKDADGKVVGEFTNAQEADRAARAVPDSEITDEVKDRVTERVVPGFSTRDNVIMTRINGEDHYIIFDEQDKRAMRMAAAMKNLDLDGLGVVLSLAGKATRYLAAINTQFNPVFGVVNLIRDAQTALLNLTSTPLAGEQKRVAGYVKDALVGIYKDLRAHRKGEKPASKWAEIFEEFQLEGGATGYRDQYANAEDRAKAIKDELAQFKEGKAKKLARGVFGWLSDYNETMENAIRVSIYRAAKEKGLSKQQAASLAKTVTVNFNRRGQMSTQVGALYAFFNASVQGSARIAETLFDVQDGDWKTARLSSVGRKIMTGGILLGSMQAMLLAAAGYDDDEPPEFVKERSLILPIGDGKYLSLPMPLGFHIIPGIGRIATEFVLSGGKDPGKRVTALAGMLADTFNPIGNSGWSLQTITPSVVDPFAALAENRDFSGREIYREDFNKLNPTPGHARAKDVATLWSRFISESLNFITGGTEYKPGMASWSPDAIDYMIGQLTGGTGREASKLYQTAEAAMTGSDLPMHKIPLFGRFVGDTQGLSGVSSKFYDAIRGINMHEAQYKGLLKEGKREEAIAYKAENPAVSLIMAGNHAENVIRKLRAQKRKDGENAKEIDEKIGREMRKFNERVATVTGDG